MNVADKLNVADKFLDMMADEVIRRARVKIAESVFSSYEKPIDDCDNDNGRKCLSCRYFNNGCLHGNDGSC